MKHFLDLTPMQYSYYQKLLEIGIVPHRALQAARSLSPEQLNLIREIWSDWGSATAAQNLTN